MAINVESTAIVNASPQEVLEFVLDLNSYRRVDDKIVAVLSIKGPDDTGNGSVGFVGRMPGLPLPPAPDWQDFTLKRWSTLEFRGQRRRPGRAVFEFYGLVECTPKGEGQTEVRHAYDLAFTKPFQRFEPRIQERLTPHLADEMTKFAAQFA